MKVLAFTHKQSITFPVILPGDEILILHPNKTMVVLEDHGIPLSKVIKGVSDFRGGMYADFAFACFPPCVVEFIETGVVNGWNTMFATIISEPVVPTSTYQPSQEYDPWMEKEQCLYREIDPESF